MKDILENRMVFRQRLRLDYFPTAIAVCLLVIPQVRMIFSAAGLRWLYILTLSFSLSYILTPLFGYIARKYAILDQPAARKVHSQATPLLGGAAVFIAFLFSIGLNGIFSFKLIVILVAAAILFAIGLVDDIRDISARCKLLAQLVSTALVVAAGIVLKVVPDSLGLFSQISNILITFLWIVGITNAMNFFDGMDGLASGLGSTISFFLGIVAFQTVQPFLGWVAVAMLGCCAGFLPHNFRINGRATIFLGDAGSTVIGFILACLAVYGNWSDTSPIVALASPVLIFWLLIFDMVHITVDRIATGKVTGLKQWLDYTDKDHLHHRMAYALGGQKKSVLFIYLMSICLGSSALLLRSANSVDALILLLQAILLVVLVTILERRGRSLARRNGENTPPR